MRTLVFLLEERSARVFLEGFLPRAFPEIGNTGKIAACKFIHFQGKQDLQNRLHGKIRGWRAPGSVFVVLQDQDREDCREAKERLAGICRQPGVKSKKTTVRIVCRQLENWYLGDLAAVEDVCQVRGLERKYANKAGFRAVDELDGERTLRRITEEKYAKIGDSRKMAEAMDPDYKKTTPTAFASSANTWNALLKANNPPSTRPRGKGARHHPANCKPQRGGRR